ncbi:secreted protein [Melampsora americana]|nr:secreted protein [Melampsora americana]
MKLSTTSFILSIIASIGLVRSTVVPKDLIPRDESIGKASCGSSDPQMKFEDCNDALLGLGDPKETYIRPGLPSISHTYGTCKVTLSTTDNSDISVSWGRVLGGPDHQSGYQWYLQHCGPTPGSILTAGGSQTSSSFLLTFASVINSQ